MTAKLKKNGAEKLNILVTEEHRDSLQTLLERIQRNAYANVLGVTSLLNFAQDAEESLEDAEIANSFRSGAVYEVKPTGPSANSYKYAQLGTAVTFERKKGGWFLTKIERVQVWPKQKGRERVSLSAKQKTIVISRLLKKFEISKEDLHSSLSELHLINRTQ